MSVSMHNVRTSIEPDRCGFCSNSIEIKTNVSRPPSPSSPGYCYLSPFFFFFLPDFDQCTRGMYLLEQWTLTAKFSIALCQSSNSIDWCRPPQQQIFFDPLFFFFSKINPSRKIVHFQSPSPLQFIPFRSRLLNTSVNYWNFNFSLAVFLFGSFYIRISIKMETENGNSLWP